MTIALTPFDGLCGFRPLAEITHFLNSVPSLRNLVGDSAAENFEKSVKGHETSSSESDAETNKKALQSLFSTLMNSDKSKVLKAATELISSAQKEGPSFAGDGGPSNNGQELADLVVRLNGQFEGDIGLFVLFFLNYVKLEVGEAMFLKADDIHAYLSGDIIECMASSDNVVRAGFTPKFQDIPTLTSMLTYSYASISEQKMDLVEYAKVEISGEKASESTSYLYDPPIEEFSVVKTALAADGTAATFEPIQGPSIVICTSGEGTIGVGPKVEDVKAGYVFFVGATAKLVLKSKGDDFTTFRAFCEL